MDLQNILVEDKIFAAIYNTSIIDNNMVMRRKQDLIQFFSDAGIFHNEYYIYYLLTKDHIRVNINEAFLKLYLQTNRALFTNNPKIDLSRYSLGETDPYVEFVQSCVSKLDELSKIPIQEDAFYMAVVQ